jgi:hypothetical protein
VRPSSSTIRQQVSSRPTTRPTLLYSAMPSHRIQESEPDLVVWAVRRALQLE